MARALIGYLGNGSEHLLAAEVARLRLRVRELEQELSDARAALTVDPVDTASMDIELHRLTSESAPALA